MHALKPLLLAVGIAAAIVQPPSAQPLGRITFLYDAFGPPSWLERDWGFAALIEYGGRRILFDTGNDATIFQRNVGQPGIDLTRLDAVIVSHRHGDHTSGLAHVLEVNPRVQIYTPQDPGIFKSEIPDSFLDRYPGLPWELQYYGGEAPRRRDVGTQWPSAHFATIVEATEILPGFVLLTTQSAKPGTREMHEVSLAIRTPQGLIVIVGCAHPGIENVLVEAAKIDSRIHLVAGGFHLVGAPEEEVQRVVAVLHDELRVERVAPGHCTSERGFGMFLNRFQGRFHQAGVGARLELR